MIIVVVTATVLVGRGSEALAAFQYTFTDLGTLGGQQSVATGINNVGQVTGYSDLARGYNQAFLWTDGVMSDLGVGDASYAYGINDRGQVVGFGCCATIFAYTGDTVMHLGGGYAFDVNNSWQIVGQAAAADTNGHAFLYSNGSKTDLGTLPGGLGSCAHSINDSGQIAGWAATDGYGTVHAFLYSGGVMTDLGTLPGGAESSAYGINESGQIVGGAYAACGDSHAFIYSDGLMTDLGTLPGGAHSRAWGISVIGEVVGYSYLAADSISHAALWRSGAIIDLNSVADVAPGWTLGNAFAINDRGQIVGSGRDPLGEARAFLLTPVPEPGDTDNDGLVGVGDLGVLAANWGQSGRTWATGDFTGDGMVNVGDLGVLAANWGWSRVPVGAGSPTPEPASVILLALGSLMALHRQRLRSPRIGYRPRS